MSITGGMMRSLIIICAYYALSAAAIFCFAKSKGLDDDAILSLVWPLWLVRSIWRACRRRYPARTCLAHLVLCLWRVGITATVWFVWKNRQQ